MLSTRGRGDSSSNQFPSKQEQYIKKCQGEKEMLKANIVQ
jgi:hypothetical protein